MHVSMHSLNINAVLSNNKIWKHFWHSHFIKPGYIMFQVSNISIPLKSWPEHAFLGPAVIIVEIYVTLEGFIRDILLSTVTTSRQFEFHGKRIRRQGFHMRQHEPTCTKTIDKYTHAPSSSFCCTIHSLFSIRFYQRYWEISEIRASDYPSTGSVRWHSTNCNDAIYRRASYQNVTATSLAPSYLLTYTRWEEYDFLIIVFVGWGIRT